MTDAETILSETLPAPPEMSDYTDLIETASLAEILALALCELEEVEFDNRPTVRMSCAPKAEVPNDNV